VIKDEKVFYTNKAFSQIVGYPLEQIMEWTTEELFKLLLAHRDVLEKLYREGGVVPKEGDTNVIPIVTGCGKTKYTEMVPIEFSFSGSKYYHAMIIDVTDEIQMQKLAAQSREQISVILDSMKDILVYYETRDLKIAWTNKEAADSLQMKPEDLIGRYCYELWQNRNEPCVDCAVLKTWETGEPTESVTSSPDGRFWRVTGWPVKDTTGNVKAVVEVTRDITTEEKAERAIRKAKARAELYLDILGHDLNNIHQGIIIGLELALQSEDTSGTIRSTLKTSLEQVSRGVNLISNIQKFSTIIDAPTKFTKTNLQSVYEAALKMVKSTFPQRELITNLISEESSVFVLADEFLVDAIFNILHNTMKHDTREVISIDISIRKSEDSKFAILQIDDRGPGIDDEIKKSLLTRLESDAKVGAGMGLTLIKRIVDRYGGRLLIEDRVLGDYSKGASFIIYLPISN
jgi:PAS domain S-box-containing protein